MKISRFSQLTGTKHTMDLDVTYEQLSRVEDRQEPIQNILPHLTCEQREFVRSGITPAEWKRHFGSPGKPKTPKRRA